jgi:hypothetical protein
MIRNFGERILRPKPAELGLLHSHEIMDLRSDPSVFLYYFILKALGVP